MLEHILFEFGSRKIHYALLLIGFSGAILVSIIQKTRQGKVVIFGVGKVTKANIPRKRGEKGGNKKKRKKRKKKKKRNRGDEGCTLHTYAT